MSDVLVERADGLLVMTLNRPDRLNAFSADMRETLLTELGAEMSAPSVRAVLLTGAGRGFCSGADLDLDTILERRSKIEGQMRTGINRLIKLMRDLPMPIVAAVNGPAAGIGVSLALASDIVLGARSTKFHLSFARIGAVLDGGCSALLTHRIGASRTAALAMLGGSVDADTARAWGLVHEVVEDDELAAAGRKLAAKLAAGPTVALGLIKRQIAMAQTATLDEALGAEATAQGRAFASSDFEEGVRAFGAKRKPAFQGH